MPATGWYIRRVGQPPSGFTKPSYTPTAVFQTRFPICLSMQPQPLLIQLFDLLFKTYGYQGWWPLNMTTCYKKSLSQFVEGYHPGDYSFPKTEEQQLEVCLGAILTQNTNWNNAVQALSELNHHGLFSLRELLCCDTNQIALAIKSAGYYNQKAKTIKHLVGFLHRHPFIQLESKSTAEVRKHLLEIKGIGPETADCILLYALHKPSFVIDAYTRRILFKLGLAALNARYELLQSLFESTLDQRLDLYQEYHALLVCHGKLHYSRKPYGISDHVLNV